jgi:hypothetical protein
MRRAVAALSLLLLAGCGLPPAFTAITYALDGASYVATGKGMGDHAISAVTEKNCAVWRVVTGELICRDYRKGEQGILVAFVETVQEDGAALDQKTVNEDGIPVADQVAELAADAIVQPVATGDPVLVPQSMSDLVPALEGVATVEEKSPVDTASFSPTAVAGPTTAVAGKARAAAKPKDRETASLPPGSGWQPVLVINPRLFASVPARRPPPGAAKASADVVLIVGSFKNKTNAQRAAGTWRDLKPAVVEARVRGKTYFRVVTGPFANTAVAGRKGALRARGLLGVWAAKLCRGDKTRPGCIALPARPAV